MPHDVAAEKRALRAETRKRRLLISDAERDAASAGVRRQLDALVDSVGARTFTCFLSTPDEPDTRDFIAGAVGRGLRVLLPSSREDGLLNWIFAPADGAVTKGLFGLPEPVGEALGPVALNDVDLLIIPAAAVDRRGMRLGWGRGYYDTVLRGIEHRPPAYAVVHDSDVVGHVPTDIHDQPVTGIVTPTRTLRLSPERP